MTTNDIPPIVRTPSKPPLPAWATALGLLSVLMAAYGLLYLLDEFLSFGRSLLVARGINDLSDAPSRRLIQMAAYVLLLIGAVLLLRRNRWARAVLIAYACAATVPGLLSIVKGVYVVGFQALAGSPDAASMGGYLLGELPRVLLPVPIFFLIWFLRPTIAREMRTWRRPSPFDERPEGSAAAPNAPTEGH